MVAVEDAVVDGVEGGGAVVDFIVSEEFSH